MSSDWELLHSLRGAPASEVVPHAETLAECFRRERDPEQRGEIIKVLGRAAASSETALATLTAALGDDAEWDMNHGDVYGGYYPGSVASVAGEVADRLLADPALPAEIRVRLSRR